MMDRTENKNTDEKKIVGDSAAALVEDGMVVGLGTGSTTAFAIQALGRRVDEGLDIQGIPTSYQSLMLAIEWGIPITSLDQDPVPDIALDGADQVDANLFVIKGGGAAHTNEKIVASSSRRFVVLVDEKKMVETLVHPVPLEVIPKALELVRRQVMELGGIPLLRMAVHKDGPVITDNGNLVMDVDFGEIADPGKLALQLSGCTGIIEHGIFDNADEIYVGMRDGTVKILKRNR
ncbi:MAG: ribose-5-phosphate isomerase RpiA [ANME-2 cluster archaeon]|nr:ribose-5-phosphate isomerase RpiA [ANME-2 cluster archaeon]